MEKSTIYVRSSKDLHDVSCDAQEAQLKKIVSDRGDVVIKVFRDKALSSTRDVRPGFDEMISEAMSKQSSFKKDILYRYFKVWPRPFVDRRIIPL